MGSFYVSLTVRADASKAFADALQEVGDSGLIGPYLGGWTTCLSQELDRQDQRVIDFYGERLSAALGAPVIAVLNHDSDILSIDLYENGTRAASYNSCPGYFASDPSEDELKPSLTDAAPFAALATEVGTDDVERVLLQHDVLAEDIHKGLIDLLDLPAYSVFVGHRYALDGESDVTWKELP